MGELEWGRGTIKAIDPFAAAAAGNVSTRERAAGLIRCGSNVSRRVAFGESGRPFTCRALHICAEDPSLLLLVTQSYAFEATSSALFNLSSIFSPLHDTSIGSNHHDDLPGSRCLLGTKTVTGAA